MTILYVTMLYLYVVTILNVTHDVCDHVVCGQPGLRQTHWPPCTLHTEYELVLASYEAAFRMKVLEQLQHVWGAAL